jgi:hypothetical protein
MSNCLYKKIIADQVFSCFVKTCIIIIIIIKDDHVVKWGMPNIQFDYKNTERLTLRGFGEEGRLKADANNSGSFLMADFDTIFMFQVMLPLCCSL